MAKRGPCCIASKSYPSGRKKEEFPDEKNHLIIGILFLFAILLHGYYN
jgi:hypothetical protein